LTTEYRTVSLKRASRVSSSHFSSSSSSSAPAAAMFPLNRPYPPQRPSYASSSPVHCPSTTPYASSSGLDSPMPVIRDWSLPVLKTGRACPPLPGYRPYYLAALRASPPIPSASARTPSWCFSDAGPCVFPVAGQSGPRIDPGGCGRSRSVAVVVRSRSFVDCTAVDREVNRFLIAFIAAASRVAAG